MKFGEAFRETIFRFRLTGVDLAQKSGVTPAQISDFRNGKNLRIDTVEKILEAMPKAAREHMLYLIASDETSSEPLDLEPEVDDRPQLQGEVSGVQESDRE